MRYLTLTGGDTRGILSDMDRVKVPEKIPQKPMRVVGSGCKSHE